MRSVKSNAVKRITHDCVGSDQSCKLGSLCVWFGGAMQWFLEGSLIIYMLNKLPSNFSKSERHEDYTSSIPMKNKYHIGQIAAKTETDGLT